MRVDQSHAEFVKQFDGVRGGKSPFAINQILQLTIFDVLHHVVRRIRVPANRENLHDIPVRGKRNKVFHFAREKLPINSAPMQVKLDRYPPAGILIRTDPNFAVRTRTEKSFD